jgi:hypothetical protein
MDDLDVFEDLEALCHSFDEGFEEGEVILVGEELAERGLGDSVDSFLFVELTFHVEETF